MSANNNKGAVNINFTSNIENQQNGSKSRTNVQKMLKNKYQQMTFRFMHLADNLIQRD